LSLSQLNAHLLFRRGSGRPTRPHQTPSTGLAPGPSFRPLPFFAEKVRRPQIPAHVSSARSQKAARPAPPPALPRTPFPATSASCRSPPALGARGSPFKPIPARIPICSNSHASVELSGPIEVRFLKPTPVVGPPTNRFHIFGLFCLTFPPRKLAVFCWGRNI